MSSAESSERKIPFTCPYCGHHTEVEARFAGQSGPCVGCSNLVSVPVPQSLDTSVSAAVEKEPKPLWLQIGMVAGGLICLGVLGVVVWAILQPAIQAARAASICTDCQSNLQQIGMALESYYQEHGEYPPAFKSDANGKKMHSWRVLILPYLGPQAQIVYGKYKMDEPWDSKDNSMLISEMPAVYRCPADARSMQGETSYLAIVGPRTVINRDKPVRRSGDGSGSGPILSDNAADTMVLVEAPGCSVNWMKPSDVDVAALRAGLNSSNPGSPGSEHPQGVNVLMADQSVLCLEDTVSTDDLSAMSTIDGRNDYIEVLDQMAY